VPSKAARALSFAGDDDRPGELDIDDVVATLTPASAIRSRFPNSSRSMTIIASLLVRSPAPKPSTAAKPLSNASSLVRVSFMRRLASTEADLDDAESPSCARVSLFKRLDRIVRRWFCNVPCSVSQDVEENRVSWGPCDDGRYEASFVEVEPVPEREGALEGTERKSANVYAIRHRGSLCVRIDRRYVSNNARRSLMI
jgi:hypothetical protein